jgi:hypothetical protein
MQVVPINYWSVVVSAVACMVLGYLWYGPLFGKQWQQLMGSNNMEAARKKSAHNGYVISFIGCLVMAFILAHSLVYAASYLGVEGVAAGLVGSFWIWLGFVVPVTLSGVLWEGKSWKLWALNGAHYLAQLLIMGAILSTWR